MGTTCGGEPGARGTTWAGPETWLETKQYRKSIYATNFSDAQVAQLNDTFKTHPCITFVIVNERLEVKSSASLFHSKEKVGATHE